MQTSEKNPSERYLQLRADPRSSFGYGLMRRTNMLLSAIDDHSFNKDKLSVVDFGCADGTMLSKAAEHLGDRFFSGTGLDVFRAGKPAAKLGGKISFEETDLFRSYPYPLADKTFDIAIVSAFLKHHPEPDRFLAEVSRLLTPNGIAIIMDPRPFVVRLGSLVGRFNPDYNPSLWSRNSVDNLLQAKKIPLVRKAYRRYWVAPNSFFFRMGIEKLVPSPVEHLVALHQCIVLTK